MKKNFLNLFLMAAVVAVMASCGGKVSKEEQYVRDVEKAVSNKDFQMMEELEKRAVDINYEDFNDDQKARLEKAAQEFFSL